MDDRGQVNRRSDERNKRSTKDSWQRRRRDEASEFMAVPGDLMGFVIGKNGSSIKEIELESGAKLSSHHDQRGFLVSGNKEQRARARELIEQKVAERETKTRKKRHPWQLVEIPHEFKRHVAGKGGDNLQNISTLTGAQLLPRGNRLYELRGSEKGVKQAELLLKRRVASARVRTDTICTYIDDRNLLDGCDLKLEPVEEPERMVLPGSRCQYRLRPSEEYESEAGIRSDIPSYQADLLDHALACLRKIKHEIESKKFQEADMWCHFGSAIIRDPDEADVSEIWRITEAVAKLQHSASGKKSDWRIAFKEGVQIDKKVLQETFSTQPTDDDLYSARYDLSFLTPRGRSIRCKVWVAKKGVQSKLEELPIPFSDVRNIVEVIHLEDEWTRSRCRAWLVLSSPKYLQADIICPGCIVDCRIMIRPLSTHVTQSNKYEQEQTKVLAGYLSKLKFTEADGIHLPDETLPQGFLFNYKRCSHRTMYVPRDGFTLIVSEESIWSSDDRGEQNRESTDLHLGCEEWDRVLGGEDWEPEMIVSKLPEFLQSTKDSWQRKRRDEASEFIAVPGDLMGFVIGKKGSSIKEIELESGAKLSSDDDQRGFLVSGNKEQRARARELIEQKVAERAMKTSKKRYPGQLVEIPSGFEGLVAGKGGDNLRNIRTLTGAQVLPRGNRLELRGSEEEVEQAELLLKLRVASARDRTDTIFTYIDDRNLPEGCDLKLVPVGEWERMVLAGSRCQYRLRPSEEYELVAGIPIDIPSYQADLMDHALACLRKIKHEIESNKFQEADMWCHFGTAIIRDLDEADVSELWNITEAAAKLQNSASGQKSDWRIALNEGVQIDKKVLQETFSTQPAEGDLYSARYDLTFLSPRGRTIRCKVWVANKGVQSELEELPIPFSDVRNIVEVIHLEDELTKSRCRAWLVLSSPKYFLADIICPGCIVDCRIMIRPLSTYVTQSNKYDQEQTKVLAGYLSKLKFTEADGIHLPDETLPQGFLCDYKRCAHRTMYVPREGFNLIVSEESIWCRDDRGEQNREITDLHLSCEEWYRELRGKDWEPEMIVSKLPEFLQFVHQVQDFLSFNNCSV